MNEHKKEENLRKLIKSYQRVAVAFSGGVDSTYLLKVAWEELPGNVIAVTATSCSFPKRELDEAKAFCEKYQIPHVIVESEELEIEGFRQNPKNRCYLCKHELFEKILRIADENGAHAVLEASNMDDNGDYRPGLVAVKELGIKSPLREAEFYKEEIRKRSKELGLSTWNKQSFACLASRFVYGETIDEEKLSMVDKAEQLLLDLGFHQLRVRIHGKLARIEVDPNEFQKLLEEPTRTKIYDAFQEYGFTYITLDLKGYRTGSMNETLNVEELQKGRVC
ncbi:MAG: ATP-dependent sacrificial sulfur transferase LarE [Lachnospiraceae bacterium]|nr:ATP-dependent sacrificial sulfur transferase LarE [Lachnospiraceae bacterium]MDD6505141.1 ATP-dependent sacrificial sulfur transferase LarE [Lachnospiraceae bacterium]